MKFREIAKGTWAVKPVTFRLANAPAAQPGQPPPEVPTEFKLGLRVLTGDEAAEVLQKAISAAKKDGVEKWDGDHPTCRLYECAHRLAIACVEVDQSTGLPVNPRDPQPVFADAAEILGSREIGVDGIVFLHDEWTEWQAERSPSYRNLTQEEVFAKIQEDLLRKEDDPGPLASMPRAMLVSCLRITGALCATLLRDRSLYGSPSDSDSSPASRPNTTSSSTTSSESSDQ